MKRLVCVIVSTLILLVSQGTAFASSTTQELDLAYWPLQAVYNTALESGDDAGITSSGEAIIALFLQGADSAAKTHEWKATNAMELGILRSVCEEVAEAYERQNYLQEAAAMYKLGLPLAIAWQDLNAPIDTEFVRRVYESKIQAFASRVSLYAELPGDKGKISYTGAKFEPLSGIYYGEVLSREIPSAKAKSAALFYVVYESEDMASFDWMLRSAPLSYNIIEIAWNLVNEGNTLPGVLHDRAKIEAAADYLQSLGMPVLLRFGAEMNVWEIHADAEMYKAAFRFVSQIMKERAPNVAMLWSPNVIGHVGTTYDMFYPGDEYVDWVGVSLYTLKHFGGQVNSEEAQAMYMTDGYADPVRAMEPIISQYGGRKPIILSEAGVEHYSITLGLDVSGFAAKQLRAVYHTLPMVYPQIKAVLYFNTKAPPHIIEPFVFELTDNYGLQQVYNELTANPYFIPHNGTGAISYSKVDGNTDVVLPANAVVLLAYAPYVHATELSVTYQLDGEWIGYSDTAPYRQSFDLSAVPDGIHTLTVHVSPGNQPPEVFSFVLSKALGEIALKPALE